MDIVLKNPSNTRPKKPQKILAPNVGIAIIPAINNTLKSAIIEMTTDSMMISNTFILYTLPPHLS